MTVKRFCIDFPDDPICPGSVAYQQRTAQTLQAIEQPQQPPQSEAGMGTFFLIVLGACGAIAAFKHYAQRSEPAYAPAFEGADVWKQLPPPRETWADRAVYTWAESPEGRQALTQTSPHLETPERGANPPTHHTPESLQPQAQPTFNRYLKQAQPFVQTRLNPNSTESQPPTQPLPQTLKFDPREEEQPGEFEYYQALLKINQWSPRGKDILKALWDAQPRGSRYEPAKVRRNNFANRLEEFC